MAESVSWKLKSKSPSLSPFHCVGIGSELNHFSAFSILQKGVFSTTIPTHTIPRFGENLTSMGTLYCLIYVIRKFSEMLHFIRKEKIFLL
jgi:hypothetical protein